MNLFAKIKTLSFSAFNDEWIYIYIFDLGDLERLRRFWLTGMCNPKKEEKKASEPLAPEQFLSAFLLLLCGILLATGLMGMEHGYMKWVRGTVKKTDRPGCCALVSLVRINTTDDYALCSLQSKNAKYFLH